MTEESLKKLALGSKYKFVSFDSILLITFNGEVKELMDFQEITDGFEDFQTDFEYKFSYNGLIELFQS